MARLLNELDRLVIGETARREHEPDGGGTELQSQTADGCDLHSLFGEPNYVFRFGKQ